MKKIVFALFNNWQQAYNALEALNHIGYTHDMLHVAAPDALIRHHDYLGNTVERFATIQSAAETLEANQLLITVETGDMGQDIVGHTLQDHGASDLRLHDPHRERVAV